MIVTLTLNPAIDTTLTVNSFKVGDTNRTNFIRRDPGGKGINVSRALLAMKEDVMTLGVVGGHSGRMFIDLTSQINMEMTWIEVEGETRMNFVVGDIETGTRTKIDQPGP
ncbi:MAG: PfkB family carbohydrate kinase, partial [Candidatus Theseobacter exili]|nr:PfkB family carbohydrate kinase [Candidatus Theseobacter exili]